MNRLLIACAVLLAVSGCAAAEPPAERDEAAYVELVRAAAADAAAVYTDDELIDQGDEVCALAKNGESSMDDLRGLAVGLSTGDDAGDFVAVMTDAAGAALCPEL